VSTGDPNPHISPGEKPASVEAGKPWAIDYMGGFSLAMQSPNWLANTCLCGLVALIPIVGQMVGLGYGFEIAESLHRSHGKTYPDFNFNRFGEYLARGVGPFLAQFLAGIVCSMPLIPVYIAVVVGVMASAEGSPKQLNQSMPMMQCGIQSISMLMNVIVLTIAFPFMVRGGLSSDIGQTFNFGEGWKTLTKAFVPCFLMSLIWNVSLILLMSLGCMALCVGIIPVLGYMYIVMGWNGYQLYRFALGEGLPPVPLKAPPPDLPPGGYAP
jgi:hypothetical protein